MNRFMPTAQTIESSDKLDPLEGAVLRGLGRHVGGMSFAWGAVVTALLGVISFGVLPLLIWSRQFGNFILVEQQRLWHLAEWLRRRSGREESAALMEMAGQMRYRLGLRMVSLAAMWGVIGVLAGYWWGHPTLRQVLAVTYRYGAQPPSYGFANTTKTVFAVWSLGLTVAYACHWTQVRWHAEDMKRFAERFNEAMAHEGMATVEAPSAGLGLRPISLVMAVLLLAGGAIWSVPMMLAGAVQWRYVKRISPVTRSEMAHRVHAMLTRPGRSLPAPVSLHAECGGEKCRAPLPKAARFCPRCGRQVS